MQISRLLQLGQSLIDGADKGAIPGSRLEIFAGVGHFPHAEEPLRFASVLTDFIETTDPALLGRRDFCELVRTHG